MPRLGDDIDDYCSRCQRTTDHSVVVMSGEEVEKTRCRTCNYEHKFRKNKGGRKEMSAQEAFAKVLASVSGQIGDSGKSVSGKDLSEKSVSKKNVSKKGVSEKSVSTPNTNLPPKRRSERS